MADETLAQQLYSKQYRKSTFISFESAGTISDVTWWFYLFEYWWKTRYGEIMHLMSLCQATRICGIIHTRLIDNKGSAFWDSVTDGGTEHPGNRGNFQRYVQYYAEKEKYDISEKRDVKEKTEIWRVNLLVEDTKLVVPSRKTDCVIRKNCFSTTPSMQCETVHGRKFWKRRSNGIRNSGYVSIF